MSIPGEILACTKVPTSNAGMWTCRNATKWRMGRRSDWPLPVFKSHTPHPGVPQLYLGGGPRPYSPLWVQTLNRPTLVAAIWISWGIGTLILLDQRGLGYSMPSLACPEVDRQRITRFGQRLNGSVYRAALQRQFWLPRSPHTSGY